MSETGDYFAPEAVYVALSSTMKTSQQECSFQIYFLISPCSMSQVLNIFSDRVHSLPLPYRLRDFHRRECGKIVKLRAVTQGKHKGSVFRTQQGICTYELIVIGTACTTIEQIHPSVESWDEMSTNPPLLAEEILVCDNCSEGCDCWWAQHPRGYEQHKLDQGLKRGRAWVERKTMKFGGQRGENGSGGI